MPVKGSRMDLMSVLLILTTFTTQAIDVSMRRRPNFVIILMDDVGYGDITSFWNPYNMTTSTPFVDYMAANGLRFVDFNTAGSNCAPSRAALLTSRLGARTGLTNVPFPTTQGGLPIIETTFGDTFNKAGYKTGMIGKWHLGHRDDFHPNSRGFDFYFGLPYSSGMGCADELGFSLDHRVKCPQDWSEMPGCRDTIWKNCHSEGGLNFSALPLFNGREIVEQPLNMTYLSLRYTDAASKFITKREPSTPFLLYVGLHHMLAPFYHMPEFRGTSARGDAYGDALLEMDWVIQTIVNVVADNGDAGNTLFWVASDNGPAEWQCEYGGNPGPFLGQWQKTEGGGGGSTKATVWEGGHRVPALAYWPGTIQGGRVSDDIVSMMDIYPTMASLAGIDMPENKIYDGLDISNVVLNKPLSLSGRVLYHPLNEYKEEDDNREMGAVRVGNFKAVYVSGGGLPECGGQIGPTVRHNPPLIFNIKEDPLESSPINPRSAEYRFVLMKANQAILELNQSLDQDNTSIVDYKLNSTVMPCCNPQHVVCRCH